MGMSIEDIIQGLKETYMICCSVFAYDRKKYIDGAIETMRKYQKIEQVAYKYNLHNIEQLEGFKKEIKEVLEDEHN